MDSECGHPIQCLRMDDAETYCAWCEDIKRLREENDGLRAQLLKDAIIVAGGEFYFDGEEIGFLEIGGGTAYLNVGQCNQVATYMECGEKRDA